MLITTNLYIHYFKKIKVKHNILIKKKNDDTFDVTVFEQDGESKTTHEVSVDEEYLELLGRSADDVEECIRHSFEFLLERESKESILRTFNLRDIARYFPEYESEMGDAP